MGVKQSALKRLLHGVCQHATAGFRAYQPKSVVSATMVEELEGRLLFSLATTTVQWEGKPTEVVADSYIVHLKAGADITALANQAGLSISNVANLNDPQTYAFSETQWSLATLSTWAQNNSGIDSFEPNVVIHAAALPPQASNNNNVPPFSDMWWLQNTGQTLTPGAITDGAGPATGTAGADINATGAWNLTTGSSTVIVAVLDTGVDIAHPDLAGHIWMNPKDDPLDPSTAKFPPTVNTDNDLDGFTNDAYGWNFVGVGEGTTTTYPTLVPQNFTGTVTPGIGSNNILDDVGHGTHVAGIIAGFDHGPTTIGGAAIPGVAGTGMVGINWNVQIMVVKILDSTGAGTTADEIAGMNYVALRKRVFHDNIVAANLSEGGPADPIKFNNIPELNAIQKLEDTGVIVVTAAGNDGTNNDVIPNLPANSPSSLNIAVAATDNQDNLASFSNYGVNTVALAAPGVDITSTDMGGGYSSESGTSFATPMVAAVLALEKAYDPAATPQQLKAALLAGADPLLNLTGKVGTGARLDALGALNALALVRGEQNATGQVTIFTNDQISGFASDPNTPTLPTYVQLFVNGSIADTVLANGPEGTGHGFVFTNETALQQPGNLQVDIKVLDNTTGNAITIKSGILNFSNELYVTFLYQTLLFRQPDLAGLTYWSTLANAGDRIDITLGITHSEEFSKNFVDNLYATLLQRAPDAASETFLVNQLVTGVATQESTEQAFLASNEYYVLNGGTNQSWVTSLYQQVLNRTASTQEINGWVTALNQGHLRKEVALDFLTSNEYRTDQVEGFYQNLLHRNGSPQEVAGWVNTNLDLLSIENGFLSSDEFYVFNSVVHPS
jgi:subtilisin family serine protease